jgi:hypothetical protein
MNVALRYNKRRLSEQAAVGRRTTIAGPFIVNGAPHLCKKRQRFGSSKQRQPGKPSRMSYCPSIYCADSAMVQEPVTEGFAPYTRM